ncbi:MAG: hypothetical protein COW00_09010 [Bdellovibrio sp. CG12_big_fil_rev_8_21_14_0_65_39_13]|nr:MAG: hypothetical protein COW78_09080 [Bdellovibrio sp. CG22_combo_CG10-13_8_21_14_all_39_27]PIQ59764.1 MAG: hypothetical protein COW00_09010 [Bdellovibrio sp. CG12_big_fil_rev_8_21_14_0_65_39_13]PIR36206.1 MAG: hypothetical protein COV37_04375 [Bdellovibrio sp. CG11_big_fil_rev_8_21_14_0_20_39_38]PJB52484.1 MAG: hypothetical protein CO099_12425 [Bdellovibrio sp. CG_4_9_14_3_um_filter_39_7]
MTGVSQQGAQKKSGIRSMPAGEVLFNQNDPASSLYIIQKGQVRLFIPKGKGFVELAILRSGEVIGEMAYFDEKSRRRSCSAAAITSVEIIEISFVAFEKTMSGLNPWFKTIINTLAERLRKTNDRVKELESNSVGYGAGGKVADYVFFHTADVIKIMSVLYLVLKTHGDFKDGIHQIHMNKLRFYLFDVFNVAEIKWEEMQRVLIEEKYMEIGNDDDGLPKIIKVADLDRYRSIVVFFNTQRTTEDSKKLRISLKCETFLKKIIDQLTLKGETNPESEADISTIMAEFKAKKIDIIEENLKDAIDAGLCGDIIVGTGNKLTCHVQFDKLKKVYPSIKLLNAIQKVNESKAGGGSPKY